MNFDASAREALDDTLQLQPTVSWPREMIIGRRHLVEVDLALVTPPGVPGVWPLEEEECAYTCALEGGGDFDLWAVHDACVVVHRFGGSYGPAEFIVTPHKETGERSLWLAIVNPWGVPVGTHRLPVHVRAAVDEEAGSPSRPVRIEVPPVAAQPVRPARAEDAASGDEITVDLDFSYNDLAESGLSPRLPADGPAVSELPHTTPDYARASEVFDNARTMEPYAGPSVPARRNGERRPARLAEWYSLAGLRRSPSGSLHWDLLPLFSPGNARGSRVTFTAHCAPSSEHGTVFAVLAEPSSGSAPAAPQLRSVQSAKVPPGIYRVTAELLYPSPGHVRFHGLPEPPGDEFRQWPDISAAVPRRLPPGTGPVHLIAAIEISGPPDLVALRIDRVRSLVEHVANTARDFVCYSVLTYGPHSINVRNPEYPEVPVTTLVQAEIADAALGVLARLSRRPAAPTGYAAAAQLECVLTDLGRQLTGQEGRPVLVTAGARPAHPPQVDVVSKIIPCRWRNDWRDPAGWMRARHAGMTFGAIHDTGSADELWRVLGTDVTTTLEDFSAPRLANALGLTESPVQLIPLPMFSG